MQGRFRFPRISITVGDKRENGVVSGKLSVLSLGFGIHQAWIYGSMFGGSRIFGVEGMSLISSSNTAFVPFSQVYLISIFVFSACLLFGSFTDQRFLRFYTSKKVLVGAALLTSLSTFAMFGAGSDTALGVAALWFSGIATGVGSCLLLLFWGTAFAHHGAVTIVVNTATAIVIAVAIYSGELHWVDSHFSGITTAILPLLELIFLWHLIPTPYYERQEIPVFNPLPIKRAPFVLRFGLPVLIFGFALGALRAMAMQAVLPNIDMASQLIYLVAAGIAMILTLFLLFIIEKDQYSDHLFRALIPFIIIAVLALPFISDKESLFASLLLLVGFMSFEALMWIFFGDISQKFRLSPIFIFGLGRGLLALSSGFGSIFALNIPDLLFGYEITRTEFALFVLVALVVAYALLPRQKEIMKMVKMNGNQQGSEASPAIDASVLGDETNEASVEQAVIKGRFRKTLETIANRYLLSRREAEVLYLLAKGHNAAFIQDKLFVSRSTVKTHISHIYRKLDICTQQELLVMIEEISQPKT